MFILWTVKLVSAIRENPVQYNASKCFQSSCFAMQSNGFQTCGSYIMQVSQRFQFYFACDWSLNPNPQLLTNDMTIDFHLQGWRICRGQITYVNMKRKLIIFYLGKNNFRFLQHTLKSFDNNLWLNAHLHLFSEA